MQSRDWDELQRLMSIAHQQSLLGEALQCVEQGPVAPVPRAKAKAKALAGVSGGASCLDGLGAAGPGARDGALLSAVIGSMTDASKRRLPKDSDWEPVDGPEALSSAAAVATFLEENNAIPVPCMPMEGEIAAPAVGAWFPRVDYDS